MCTYFRDTNRKYKVHDHSTSAVVPKILSIDNKILVFNKTIPQQTFKLNKLMNTILCQIFSFLFRFKTKVFKRSLPNNTERFAVLLVTWDVEPGGRWTDNLNAYVRQWTEGITGRWDTTRQLLSSNGAFSQHSLSIS